MSNEPEDNFVSGLDEPARYNDLARRPADRSGTGAGEPVAWRVREMSVQSIIRPEAWMLVGKEPRPDPRYVVEPLYALSTPAPQPVAGGGYVFINPDSGEEYSPDHPIESGAAPEAESVRQSTGFEDWLVGEVAGLKSQLAGSGNYVANTETAPTEVTFSNGRVVRLSADGTHLIVSSLKTPSPGEAT